MTQTPHRQLVVKPPSVAASDVGPWLWAVEDARARTLALFRDRDRVDVDRVGGAHTVGSLLYHIAAIEADWLFAEVREEPFPAWLEGLFPRDVRDGEGRLARVTGESLDDHLRRLARVREALLETFSDMTATDFRRPRSLPDYDVTPEWVLHHLAQHEAGHRQQIASILAAATRE